MNGRLWTDEEIQTLKAMIGWKATIEMMCEALSRSKDSIVAKATQLGLVAIQRQKSTGKNLIQVPFRNTQSLTAFLLGDPPPGRSALDMRGQA